MGEEYKITDFNISDVVENQYRIQHFKKIGTGHSAVWRATLLTPAGITLVNADVGYLIERIKDSHYPMNETNLRYLISIIRDEPETIKDPEPQTFAEWVRYFVKVKAPNLKADAFHLGENFVVISAPNRRQFKKLRKKMEKEAYNNPEWTPCCSTIDKVVKMHRMAIYSAPSTLKGT